MKKILLLTTLSIILIFFNCATVVYGPYGGLYTSTTIGNSSTGKEGNKTGEACAHSVLGLIAFGDASVKEAQLKAQIKEVTSIDHSIFNILGIYGKMCTIVSGN